MQRGALSQAEIERVIEKISAIVGASGEIAEHEVSEAASLESVAAFLIGVARGVCAHAKALQQSSALSVATVDLWGRALAMRELLVRAYRAQSTEFPTQQVLAAARQVLRRGGIELIDDTIRMLASTGLLPKYSAVLQRCYTAMQSNADRAALEGVLKGS